MGEEWGRGAGGGGRGARAVVSAGGGVTLWGSACAGLRPLPSPPQSEKPGAPRPPSLTLSVWEGTAAPGGRWLSAGLGWQAHGWTPMS